MEGWTANQPDALEEQIEQILEGSSGKRGDARPPRVQERPSRELGINPKKRKRREDEMTTQEKPRQPRPEAGTVQTEKIHLAQPKRDYTSWEILGAQNITHTRQDGGADLNNAKMMRRRKSALLAPGNRAPGTLPMGKNGRNYLPILQQVI